MATLRYSLLCFLTLILPASTVWAGSDYKIVEQEKKPSIPFPDKTEPFLSMDAAGKANVTFIKKTSSDINQQCSADTTTINLLPKYPNVFYVPCPKRTLAGTDTAGTVTWQFPLEEQGDREIGYGNNRVIIDAHDKRQVLILSSNTGEITQKVPYDILGCENRSPWAGYVDAAHQNLYIHCVDFVNNEGNLLNKVDLSNHTVTPLYHSDKQFLGGVASRLSHINIDSSGRFLIFSEVMPSRLSSWGRFTVLDTVTKKVIAKEKIYKWSWDVDIASGKNQDFAIGYLCDYNERYQYCTKTYKIIQQ